MAGVGQKVAFRCLGGGRPLQLGRAPQVPEVDMTPPATKTRLDVWEGRPQQFRKRRFVAEDDVTQAALMRQSPQMASTLVVPIGGPGADRLLERRRSPEIGMGLVGSVMSAVVGAVELIISVHPANDLQQLGLRQQLIVRIATVRGAKRRY